MLSDSLKVFITVADKKNFSKAAKALNLTQPAISFQIQTLEQYYQTMLFDRVNRHVKLTEAGELLLEYALSMNDLQSQLERKMQQLTGHVKGTLMIGASRTVGEYIMPYIICAFKNEYTDVDITLEIYNTKHVEELVLSNHLDVGLVESQVKHDELMFQSILEDELVIVVPITHPWAEREEVTLDELAGEPFIIREPGSGSRLVFEQALIDAEFDVESLNIIMEIGNITAIKSAIISGLGISVMSKWAARDMVEGKMASIVRIKDLKMPRRFNILLNENHFESEACSHFIHYLAEADLEKILEQK
ncbi:MAG: selenium metabolism-associated LysR family transcriptional regulator [Clostridiales bacterium]|uniref:DNA-binding transcriptional regulator, LysR family n=1 Tax=Peptococcus niger TaxID=2741 RepID=A0A1G6RZR0_PEPNI|nr:selenium metabolism-associated LysR family transcriptional regulator [Peptococcus niger]MBS5916125.1 LysR family transcriptional regulator [Clostridiales bacterium]MDU1029194.1 selenium metabolism-associated LysR family transcriptional regulator [Clostridiales bacterium]SDD10162.1 DNA-binding transcriptional regulator, LysR family [Peptococcus niger]